MDALIKKFDLLVKYICVVSITIMVLLIFVNTVMRYCINSSIVATEELCRFFFVWATFMAVIPVWREKGHIAVTALTDHLHGNFKKWFSFFWSFLILFALGALAYGSYEYIQENSYYIQITGISYGFIISKDQNFIKLRQVRPINCCYFKSTGTQTIFKKISE